MTPLILTLCLLRGADVAMTVDLGHRYGGREVNPLLPQNPAAMAGVMAGVTVAQTWALVRLDDDHPRLARVLAWTSIVLEGVAVVHNAREDR
jgi:hypothetical protein